MRIQMVENETEKHGPRNGSPANDNDENEELIRELRSFRYCDAEIRGPWEIEAMLRFYGMQ